MSRPVAILVGPPGAGKSTVGKLLADRLGVTLRDTDLDVERALNMSVADAFVNHGEPYFRSAESEAVRTAVTEHDGVISLGGGAVLDPETRRVLASETVVFLDVGLAAAVKRVGLGTSRPLLLGNVRAQLKSLLDARRELYSQVANVTIQTDELDPSETADAVVRWLESS